MITMELGMASLGGLVQWLRQEAQASPVLGGFGALVIAAVLIGVSILIVRAVLSGLGGLAWRAKAAKLKSDRRPGYFFLVAPFTGQQAARTRAFTEAALSTHLSAFSFNAPSEVHGLSRGMTGKDKIEAARAMMAASEADLVLWGEAVKGRNESGLRLEGIVRQAGGSTADAREFTLWLPGTIGGDNTDFARLIAYAVCRQVQPALGRPEDFRADRLEPIARRFGSLLEAFRGKPNVAILRQLQDDYAAAALHIGETKPDPVWLETASRAYEAIIANGRAGDADRWTNAKLGLGRAMLLIAEKRYDPVKVQEGTAHIRAALDVLRGHPKLRAADIGIASLRKAEQMLENRRRFSITWPV